MLSPYLQYREGNEDFEFIYKIVIITVLTPRLIVKIKGEHADLV